MFYILIDKAVIYPICIFIILFRSNEYVQMYLNIKTRPIIITMSEPHNLL